MSGAGHGNGPVQLTFDGPIGVLQLNRPPMNPFDTAMRDALITAARELADRPGVRACVVHGGQRHFAAGADIKQLASMNYEETVSWNAALQKAFHSIAELPFPVVAAVNGYALGGGFELALAADIRVGSTECTVGLPEITLGIIPGAGGTQRLTQIVGRSRAKLLIMTGRHVKAAEAHELGLLDVVVEPGATIATAEELARDLANRPPLAVRAAKEAIDAALPLAPNGLALERSLLAGTFATTDRDTAMAAFLERQAQRAAASGRRPDPDAEGQEH